MYTNQNKLINKFYDANEGFFKGNLFKEIYMPYKYYKPKEITPSNKKEALLLFIQKCDLAIQDLNLYLDIKENDQDIIKLLNFYKEEYKKACEQYLKEYGQLLHCQITNTFKWNDYPFPWED